MPNYIRGVVRSPGRYADSMPRFEIDIWKGKAKSLVIRFNQRVPYKLRIGDGVFLCGLNSTELSGSWIAPNLILEHSNTKVRLSEKLLEAGFKQNEEVRIEFRSELNELILLKKNSANK
jgi:hypothetical protein